MEKGSDVENNVQIIENKLTSATASGDDSVYWSDDSRYETIVKDNTAYDFDYKISYDWSEDLSSCTASAKTKHSKYK